ncbi:MAG: hypothetical protein JW888_09615, partial [Pirellulales bacterium]|nr:hypothetical protein [Pirellulales bacterium]
TEVQAVSDLGGSDTAFLHGSTSNDVFTGDYNSSQMETGDGFVMSADGFRFLYAYSEGYADGDPLLADRVYLYDSPGDDTFTSTPTLAKLNGSDYNMELASFRYVDVYSQNGGIDHANMFDSPGDDVYTATGPKPNTPNYAELRGDTFKVTAHTFRYTAASAAAGGYDLARLYDSPGEDTFEAAPTYGKLYGAGFYNRADYFDKVEAHGDAGGEDVVRLYDSAGDDELKAGGANDMTLIGSGFNISASNFQHVVAFADQGHDVATFYGTNGDDTFIGTPVYGKLTSGDRTFRAYGFDEVNAWGKGGNDKAYLKDSALADLFEARGSISNGDGDNAWARLSNEELDFLLWVANFEEVHAESTSSGDRADIGPEVDFVFLTGIWEDI